MDEWEAVRSYFIDGARKLSEHQVESFEDFIRVKIPLILQSTPPILVCHEQDETTKKYKYEFKLTFENPKYVKPKIQEITGRVKPMFPAEARIRNFTYSAQMFVDVRFSVSTRNSDGKMEEDVRVFENIPFSRIPVMLGSSLCLLKEYPLAQAEMGECSYDPLGYFIIHGSERVILCQEKVADNRIMIFQNKKTSITKYSYSVEIKSLHESMTLPPKKLDIQLSSKFNGFGYPLLANVPRFKDDIPVAVYFRAFGVISDRNIAELVFGDADDVNARLLAATFKETSDLNIFTQEDAIRYLSTNLQYVTNHENKEAYVIQLLGTECLPHVRFAGDNSSQDVIHSRKCILMASMIHRLLRVAGGQTALDDRDAYPNKRIVTTGSLLTHLFRQLFQKVCSDTRGEFVHEINNDRWKKETESNPIQILNLNNIHKVLKLITLESKLKQALATGNFLIQGVGQTTTSTATKVGVSQVLSRMSYSSMLSHMRRIQTPVEKSGKLLAPRKLHGSSWGFMCPVETPEGHSVGIVKTMCLLTTISQYTPSNIVLHVLKNIENLSWIEKSKSYQGTSITLNGVIIAYTLEPTLIVEKLRQARTSGWIHPHVSIAWYILLNNIVIETDGGRAIRPVFRVGAKFPEGADAKKWENWVKTCIDFIDPSETETLRIASNKAELTEFHTHYEIHPSLLLGHMASSIPLSDHNQSPRNTYQSAMGKQSMCVYAENYAKRLDKNGYMLCSLMRPIVETKIMNILNAHKMPFGVNAIVAIACYGGYNQEDSILLNKTSVARGLFRGLYYGMYKDEEHRNISTGKEEKFMRPQKHNTRKFKNSSYAAITESGAPALNSILQENDVIIGKATTLKNDPTGYAYADASVCHKNAEPCRIDGVWRDKNSDGYPFIKVKTVSERIPTIGDKCSSRHGQKGTIGALIPEEDMPFTAEGLRPDIIMNPHAVPSRMTIAQLMENIFGKIGVRSGGLGDGTPYSHLKIKELREQMLQLGLHPYGNEILYNGQTGEMMEAEIFMGPTFYQRLKHMVIDKSHSRSKGPIVSLTRQPCEGRARDGGLRVGEMERDCMLSHGISAFTKERLMDVSDPFESGFCRKCGIIATINKEENIYLCSVCGAKTDLVDKTIPYAMKLWMQELEAMHIVPRVQFNS
jgi:DNA-directed RNA polymerase II subunit RPB2